MLLFFVLIIYEDGKIMDFLDYREKLKIAFDDQAKISYLMIKVFNVLTVCEGKNSSGLDFDEYFRFCNVTGTQMDESLYGPYHSNERFQHCIEVLSRHTTSISDFLSYYIAFVNTVKTQKNGDWARYDFVRLITKMMEEAHIAYELLENDGEYFVFPKGARELDNALISEPLEWLKGYSKAHKTYCVALRQYSDGEYIRDTADNLRKTLEAFFQEFLENDKNLETNKNEICRYLGKQGVDAGIAGLFQPLINAYKNINDRIAKHDDKVDGKLLEFLLYQTGVLIRMVLAVKQGENLD